MAHVISCHSCGQKSAVSNAIFEKRIAGKKVTLRCTQCREPIPVDGTTPGELRVIPPAPHVTASPTSPAKASPPPTTKVSPPPPAKASPPPTTKVSPPPPARARVTADYGRLALAPPPASTRTPIPRDEMVTVPEDAFDEPTRVAPIPVASPTSRASSPPLALATTLQAALAPVATPPSLLEASSAPPLATPPTSELELTPPAVACAVELPSAASTAGLARDESAPPRDESTPRQRGRGVARVALLSAIPLAAAAALAFGVLPTKLGGGNWEPVALSALPPVLKAAAAKLYASPPSKPVIRESEVGSPAPPPPASAPVSAPVPVPVPSLELAPPPAPVLANDAGPEAPSEELTIPSYVKAPVVLHRTQLALRQAERCHPYGHAVGTARIYVTFAPNGRVVDARLEGEPLAGAPVARCLLDHARSIRLPKFKGEPFTIQQEVTLR